MTIKEFTEKLKAIIIINNTDEGYLDDNVDMECLLQDIDELVNQAEQERTNFEKLKDELTVKKYYSLIEKCCDEKCPLYWTGCRNEWIELYRKTVDLSQIEGYCKKIYRMGK